jgi:hypothetical protein
MHALPPPPPAIVRTAEELGIDLREPPGMRITSVAEQIYAMYKSGDPSPSRGNVTFEAASESGMCQQNVRELVELSIFGHEGDWAESGCCATQTEKNLHHAANGDVYERIADLQEVQLGDLVYLKGSNVVCSRCGHRAGHVMVCVAVRDGTPVFWQNLSGLCEEPMWDWQRERFVAAYRFKPNKRKAIPRPPTIEEQLAAATTSFARTSLATPEPFVQLDMHGTRLLTLFPEEKRNGEDPGSR